MWYLEGCETSMEDCSNSSIIVKVKVKVEVKVNFSLCLIRHYAMKTRGIVEV
jgi:hypothetical protein